MAKVPVAEESCGSGWEAQDLGVRPSLTLKALRQVTFTILSSTAAP